MFQVGLDSEVGCACRGKLSFRKDLSFRFLTDLPLIKFRNDGSGPNGCVVWLVSVGASTATPRILRCTLSALLTFHVLLQIQFDKTRTKLRSKTNQWLFARAYVINFGMWPEVGILFSWLLFTTRSIG